MNIPQSPVTDQAIHEVVLRSRKTIAQNRTKEILQNALSCIDLTTLNSTDTVGHVAAFTHKVNAFSVKYPELGNVAAICVYPNMVQVVKEHLAVDNVSIAAVAGGFPSSMTWLSLKKDEARLAVIDGADEIDIVIPLWAFLGGNYSECFREVSEIKQSIGDAHLKVILETGALPSYDAIWKASWISLEAGGDFIKTSTGKMPVAATPEAAVVMCYALRQWFDTTGERRGFKPAGGIVTPDDALLYYQIVEDILGHEWQQPRLFRIGASRLANHLLSELTGSETLHF